MSYVLIIGAKSDIAKATAKVYAMHGYNLYLAARKPNELQGFANDVIAGSNINIKLVELDVVNYKSHQAFYENLDEKPIGVIVAAGYLGKQDVAQKNFAESQKIIDTNYIGLVSLLNIISNDFEHRRNGFLTGISSVAGDRGRKRNYIYGSAKSAFTTYLSGLRSRLYASGVHVLTVKPGYVATKMIKGMNLPERLIAQPETVAEDIYNAQQNYKNVLYTKWVWRWVMLIIKMIPEWIFKKINI